MIEVDATGLSCPIPVVKTMEAMKNNPKEEIVVFVDNSAAKENVSRLAKTKKYSIEVETTAKEEYKLLLKSYESNRR